MKDNQFGRSLMRQIKLLDYQIDSFTTKKHYCFLPLKFQMVSWHSFKTPRGREQGPGEKV